MNRKTDLGQWLVCVPARFAAQRLPGKPLQDLGGKPLIVRVCENLAPLAEAGAEIVVATDSEAVERACSDAGVRVQMTRNDHPSGTDRCNEVAQRRAKPWILNVQGDEPFVDTADLIRLMTTTETAGVDARQGVHQLATLAARSLDGRGFASADIVKIICARADAGAPGMRAIYFTRAPAPWERGAANGMPARGFWHHQGVYAFGRSALAAFCKLGPSPLEETEKLEQLRAIEAGWPVLVVESGKSSRGIDTPEDLEAARRVFAN